MAFLFGINQQQLKSTRVYRHSRRVGASQALSSALTVSIILSTTVHREMALLVNDCASLGISTGIGCAPECVAEVNISGLIGVDVGVCGTCATTIVGGVGGVARHAVVVRFNSARKIKG